MTGGSWSGFDDLRRPLRLVVAIVALALAGAAAFGLWHLVVGGLINGNPRAGTFGLILSLAAGIPLAVAGLVMRHRRARGT